MATTVVMVTSRGRHGDEDAPNSHAVFAAPIQWKIRRLLIMGKMDFNLNA